MKPRIFCTWFLFIWLLHKRNFLKILIFVAFTTVTFIQIIYIIIHKNIAYIIYL